MKKLFLLIIMAIVAVTVNAENWTVTVTINKTWSYIDANTYSKEVGVQNAGTETFTIPVTAETKYLAEQQAITRCLGMCQSRHKIKENVMFNGVKCNVFEKREISSTDAKKAN